MIKAAVNQGMEYSGTSSGDVLSQRFKSYTSWIRPDESSSESKSEQEVGDDARLSRYLTELSAHLFFPDEFTAKDSACTCSAEALQIVRYLVGGKYDMHHDGYNRFVTMLTYLNGIAG